MTLLELRNRVRLRLNNLRSIERILSCVETEIVTKDVVDAVDKFDSRGLKRAIKSHETPLHERSYRNLREIAKGLGFLGWSRLSREELILQITKEFE
jgi:histidyl-tRNA synthetase